MTGAWRPLAAVWALVSVALVALYLPVVRARGFGDPDDFTRLLQLRDLLGGQGWWDVTQYRFDPPTGLGTHWSRLVDAPLWLFAAPLTPLVGVRGAETAALTGAPLLTLALLMAATARAMRALHPSRPGFALLGAGVAIVAPLVLAQIHPGRIDHHGWQIALAMAAFAALLGVDPRRSGIMAGIFVALLLAISIEGAPFAAALLGAAALLWVAGREQGARVAGFVQALALASIAAFALFAPAGRWGEVACDAMTPMHLAMLVIAAVAVTLAVNLTTGRMRIVALCLAAVASAAPMLALAPQCATHPFGALDPLVMRLWVANVSEIQPFWRQSPIDAVAMIAFPLIGVVGAALGLSRAVGDEARRRWLLALLVGVATLVTGALVRRAAGIAQVIAIPGAFVLIEFAFGWANARATALGRAAVCAGAVLIFSPLAPVVVAAAALPTRDDAAPPSPRCDPICGLTRLNMLPPQTIFAGVDLGPELVLRTHHSAFAAPYHRLRTLGEALTVFTGNDAAAHAFLTAHDLRLVVVEPGAGEMALYRHAARDGFAVHLIDGKAPLWLRRLDRGDGALMVYARIDGRPPAR